MSEITLESLGLTKEEIQKRIVERICDGLMEDQLRYDGEGESESWRTTPFAKALDKRIKEHIDAKVSALFEAHVIGKVEAMVHGLTLQKTNDWGEPKAEPITFVQYLIQRAERYMTEQVDYEGRSKGKNHYGSWNAQGTRITHIVEKYLHFHIEQAMKTILEHGNATLVEGIEKTVSIKLAEISKKLKVEVKTR